MPKMSGVTGPAGRSHKHSHRFRVDADGDGRTTATVISSDASNRADPHTHSIVRWRIKPAKGHAHDKPGGHTHPLQVSKLSKEVLIHAYLYVIQEMVRRGHPPKDPLSTPLGRAAASAAGALGFNKDILRELGLTKSDDRERFLPLEDGRDHVLIPDFVSIVGSAMRREPNDLDFCVRSFVRDESLEILLRREMGKTGNALHFIYNPTGPHGDSLPLFDLVLRRKVEPCVRKVHTETGVWDEKAGISPLTRFQPLKPKAGRGRGEFFDPEQMYEQWARHVIAGGIVVEPKFNGFRTVLQKDAKGNTLIYFEGDKRDRSKNLPGVAADLKKIEGAFIVDAELQELDPDTDTPVARTALQRFTGNDVQEDKNVVLNVFDILYYDGVSIGNEPLSKRRAVLAAWLRGAGPRFLKVNGRVADSKDSFLNAVTAAQRVVGSEGAMAKVLQSIYTLAGVTDSWAKLRTLRRVVASVLRVNKTPNPKLRNYTMGLGPITEADKGKFDNVVDVGENSYVQLGNTFNTSISANVGDNLEVMVAEVLVDRRKEKIDLSWVLPFVEAKTPDSPYSPSRFMEIALPSEIIKRDAVELSLFAQEVLKAMSTNQKRFNARVKQGSKGKFVLHLHERGTDKPPISRHLDIRMSVDDQDTLEGILLTSGKIPTTGEFTAAEFKKLIDGGAQMLMPDFKPPQPKEWLNVGKKGPVEVGPGDVGATRYDSGRFVALDFGTWEALEQDDHHKAFRFSGERGSLSGRFVLNGIPASALQGGGPENRKTDRIFVFKKEAESKSTVKLLNKRIDKEHSDRQIVFGVVLEPDVIDAQNDTVGPEEIERAAHRWLAKFQNRGLMHTKIVNNKIEIYESYIAPVDLVVGGQDVKKGTWLLMLHITDDELWSKVKSGELTGFSMGGYARRVQT